MPGSYRMGWAARAWWGGYGWGAIQCATGLIVDTLDRVDRRQFMGIGVFRLLAETPAINLTSEPRSQPGRALTDQSDCARIGRNAHRLRRVSRRRRQDR